LNAHVAQEIRRFGYTGQVFTIPNGRDLARYQACSPADVTQAEKHLIFVGFISPRKNQQYLLDVLKALPGNYNLRLIGEPLDPAYERRLVDYAAAQHIDNVEFTGPVQHEALPAYYAASQVLVSASKIEVQSLVIIEALASGTPVVGLSNETTDELVDETVGACLPKDTAPAEFAARVVQLCSLPPAEYLGLCQAARDRVRHLDWANVLEQLDAAYTVLCQAQAAREGEAAQATPPLWLGPVGRQVVTRTLALKTRVSQVRRVPQRTWLFAGLTAAGSVLLYLFLKFRSRQS
jgi:glycosyltransferase involved in cell wall biosynthesis